MYVEHCTYTAHPGKLGAWLKLYEDLGGPASDRHLGQPLGFFKVEFGVLNQVVFIRGIEDIDRRHEQAVARDQDAQWQAFCARCMELGALAHQESRLMKTVPFGPLHSATQPFVRQFSGEGFVVEQRTFDLLPGKLKPWLKAYRELALPVQERHLGQFVFMGVTEAGPLNQVVYMWAYSSLADRDRRRDAVAADPAWGEFAKVTASLVPYRKQSTAILRPTAWSTMR